MNQEKKRNCMVFEAPKELTEQARTFAQRNMVSTSAVCRQALNKFLQEQQYGLEREDIPTY